MVAVGRAGGGRVTGRDGWEAGKEYGNGDGGREVGSSVWLPWPEIIIGTRITVTIKATVLKEQ